MKKRSWRYVFGVGLWCWMMGFVCASIACSPKSMDTQAKVANTIGLTVNGLVPMLRDIEELEGDRAIKAAPDKESARKALAAIEAKWKPIWDAQKAAQVTQAAWATAIEKGGDQAATLDAAEKAFCKLNRLLPPDVFVLPIADLVCPKEASDAGS